MATGLSWSLILNDSHRIKHFSSKKELMKWAKEFGFEIKRSLSDGHVFYVSSIGYIPGNK